MEITLMQGLLLTLLAFFLTSDVVLEYALISRPLITSTLTGIILGEPALGLAGGALCELTYVGLVGVGGVPVPNPLIAAIMTVVLAYTNQVDVAAALGLSLPFALLAQYLSLIARSMFSGFMPKIDAYAKEGDTKKFIRLVLFGPFLYMLMYALLIFLSVYAMQQPIIAFVNSFPEFLVHGLKTAGNLLPGIGLACLLRVMLKKENISYLFIGFLMATYLQLGNVLPVAIAGAAVAFIGYLYDKGKYRSDSDGGEISDGI